MNQGSFALIVGKGTDFHTHHRGQIAHFILDIDVEDRNQQKQYECDVNIHSEDGTNIQICMIDEAIKKDDCRLNKGIHTDVTLSYVNDLKLKDSDFKSIDQIQLTNLLLNFANTADSILIYGTTYHDPKKSGIHDIHYNYPHSDGAIGFYYGTDKSHIQWIYLKFITQHLNRFSLLSSLLSYIK